MTFANLLAALDPKARTAPAEAPPAASTPVDPLPVVPDIAAVQAATAHCVSPFAFAPVMPTGTATGRVEATQAYQTDRDPRR